MKTLAKVLAVTLLFSCGLISAFFIVQTPEGQALVSEFPTPPTPDPNAVAALPTPYLTGPGNTTTQIVEVEVEKLPLCPGNGLVLNNWETPPKNGASQVVTATLPVGYDYWLVSSDPGTLNGVTHEKGFTAVVLAQDLAITTGWNPVNEHYNTWVCAQSNLASSGKMLNDLQSSERKPFSFSMDATGAVTYAERP